MATVTLAGVGKVYDGKVKAVEAVDLTIGDGEFVVLVGPSGCGKSTTLRMVAGLEEISEGTIAIDGRVVNGVHPKDRDIAMVFQNYALYPHMTVRRNMAFGLQLRKMARAEIGRRVDEAARMLGLVEYLERKPKALSGGQRQRVALGRAIVREPKVFLFDEPLSNLDAKLRSTTRTEIKNLHQRLRTTTIYVTHDQEEAMTLGDRIVVMSAGRGVGRVEQVGSPLEVYNRPVNRFVGAFIGRAPMNFIEGVLERDGDGGAPLVFRGGGMSLRLLPEQCERLSGRVGSPVVLGLRPNALAESASGKYAGRENSVELETVVVEPLGNEIDVSCRLANDAHLLARLDAREGFPAGQRVRFDVDLGQAQVFAPGEFGENLLLGRGDRAGVAGGGG
ncbi:MAG: ABC transporter ATP-binding protein [Phycisphaerales bacterium]